MSAGRLGAAGVVAMVVPGGLALVGGGAAATMVARIGGTGVPYLDALRFRWALVAAAVRAFGPSAVFDATVPRALVALAHNEIDPHAPGFPYAQVGDRSSSGGPSVGPLQVYRRTAVDLGLWTPPAGADDAAAREAYEREAAHLSRVLFWGARVFKDKLRQSGGDVAEAMRRYNGSGEQAEAYRARAVAFAEGIGWKVAA